MRHCSHKAGKLPVEGEQIVMLPSHKGNNCFIMPINIFSLQCEKKNTDQHCLYFTCSPATASI